MDDGGAATVRAIMHWQYRTISKGNGSIFQKLCSKLGPIAHDFISFFGLRTYGRLIDGGPVVTSQVYFIKSFHFHCPYLLLTFEIMESFFQPIAKCPYPYGFSLKDN